MSIKLNRKYQNVWCMKMCWKPLRLASRIFLHFPQSSANRCQILLSKNSYFNRFKHSKPDETATWLHWNRTNYATPKSLRKVWEKNVYSAQAFEFSKLDAHFYIKNFYWREVFWSMQHLTQDTVSLGSLKVKKFKENAKIKFLHVKIHFEVTRVQMRSQVPMNTANFDINL